MRTAPASAPPLSLALDPAGAGPLHARLREALRAAILTRRLPRGARIPASRSLAADLGCARGTVLLAIEQLTAEGYLTARPGSGTRVSATLPDDVLPRPVARAPDAASVPILSRRGLALATATPETAEERLDAFALGRPATDAFPLATFARLLQAEWRHGMAARPLPLGDPRLRRAVAAYLSAGRGIVCEAEDVVVTVGIRQSLRLLAQLLLEPGEAAFVEDPGFPGIARALEAVGVRPVPAPVGPGGFAVAAAAARAPEARLAVVTPAHHYPLGHAMSLENRLDLLAWAEKAGGFVVENDYDGAYRYGGRPLSPLRALDRRGCVVYVGSFSKVLLPALELGYMVLPPGLAEPVRRALAAAGPVPAALAQGALARFIEEGHFAAHLRRTRRLYAARQDRLVAALRAHAAGLLEADPQEGGLHLVARPGPAWPAGLTDTDAAAACARAGVATVALSGYHADPEAGRDPAARGLLLGYAAVPERAVEPAVRRMAEALRAARSPS